MLCWGSASRLIEKSVEKAGAWFASITSLATVLMILTGALDILGTTLFNSPVPATYESTEALMVALVFGGLAYAQTQKRHVRVEFLTLRLMPPWKAGLDLFGLLMGLGFFVLFSWSAWGYFWESWAVREFESSGIRFPIYPTKFIMFAGSALITLQLFIDSIKGTKRLFR
ncbi:MAG: TRAP transporter small permease [Desulfobacteraceae bacterium]|nr:MAG: TRAP transporter small permease [Desulfobacteraceae bacterium]